VLVAVELALERVPPSGRISEQHVINVLARLRRTTAGQRRDTTAGVDAADSRHRVWRVNLRERRATIWMRSVSRLGDDARHLIVAGLLYAGGWLSLGFGMPTVFGVA